MFVVDDDDGNDVIVVRLAFNFRKLKVSSMV